MFESGNKTDASFEMKIDDFPKSPTGNIHVTTAKMFTIWPILGVRLKTQLIEHTLD